MSDRYDPTASIVDFTAQLIKTSSRAIEDAPKAILDVIGHWAQQRRLTFHRLYDDAGADCGGYFHYSSGKSGMSLCLNACVDTCSFGAEELWTHPPTAAFQDSTHLYGRGAADSKVAVAIFCHIFEQVAKKGLEAGELYLLLDADEHTGRFGGIKQFLSQGKKPDAVFIGYSGNDEIFVGARGFLRSRITVMGTSAHTGSRQPALDNAILKAARLAQAIAETALPVESDRRFPFGPKVTVTGINGGQGFSSVPDKVEVNVDMRLTPDFNEAAATQWLTSILSAFDKKSGPVSQKTIVEYLESWPCYALPDDFAPAKTLKEQASATFGKDIPLRVAGPSNIGNLLAANDIPALCGFGVSGHNIHGTDESMEIKTVLPVYQSYLSTILKLCR